MTELGHTTIDIKWTDDIEGEGFERRDIGRGTITEIVPPLSVDELRLLMSSGIVYSHWASEREATDDSPAMTVIRREQYYSEKPSETITRTERAAIDIAEMLIETRGRNTTIYREGIKFYGIYGSNEAALAAGWSGHAEPA